MTDEEKRELKHGYVTLKEHLEKIIDLRFKSAETALSLNKRELERRLETLNELRNAVEKDRSQFVKQDVYDTKTAYYDEWCRGVDKKLAYWSAAIVIIVFLMELAVKIWGYR